jgi:hypothetical protein
VENGKAGIKIAVTDAELDRIDGFSVFELEASSGSSAAAQRFYAQRDAFVNFGNQLKSFPSDINSRIKIEFGGPEKPSATYLLLEVFCYDPTGMSAIKIRMETHFIEPHYDTSEFFIICYPAALNILGEKLYSWNPLNEGTLEWHADSRSEAF